MSTINVSVVLNMHREALFLTPTLRSLDLCAAEAQKDGIKTELVAVFDRADEATRAVFCSTHLSGFCAVKTLEIDVGSLGLARNAGVQVAGGEFILTADGDDLLSSNSIVECFKVACNHPNPKVVVFADYLVAFGDEYHVARYQSSEWLTAADFAFHHPYVSRIFIRRSAFDSLCYRDLKVTSGFAYEDWDLNARLFADDYEFLIAKNTVLFYRQRSNSLLRQANAVSSRLIPHSSLFDPNVFQAAMTKARKKHQDWSSFIAERQRFSERNFAKEFLAEELMIGFLAEAVKLDPEIEPTRIECAGSYSPVPWDPKHWGFQLERFYQLLGSGLFSDVLLLPWLKPGGAEKYILQILHALHAVGAMRRLLVIAGQPACKHEWVGKLPKGSIFIDLFNTFPMLEDSTRDTMLARALLAVTEPEARLHIKASEFSHRLIEGYGAVLSSHFKIVYYRFSDSVSCWRDMRLTVPWGISFLRRHLPQIDLLISDCHSIASSDMVCLGAHLEKHRVIYASCRSSNQAHMQHPYKKRLLWASRVSTEKKPELVSAIATALRHDHPDIVIEVYGQIEEHSCRQLLFDVPGVEYRGPFDGFDSLPVERYDALIYTSAFDGLPNIILEALGAGLPVIAPDVGGISEAVIDGETGFLVPDLVDDSALVAAYVKAVRRLYGDSDRVLEIANNGRRLIAERHSDSSFRRRVAEAFELEPGSVEAII